MGANQSCDSKDMFFYSEWSSVPCHRKISKKNTGIEKRSLKPGFHMIVTIVTIATIIKKFHWTIATILTIHGFHMIVAIAAVFMVECIKADDGYSVFTSVITDRISPNSESIACYLFVLYEN